MTQDTTQDKTQETTNTEHVTREEAAKSLSHSYLYAMQKQYNDFAKDLNELEERAHAVDAFDFKAVGNNVTIPTLYVTAMVDVKKCRELARQDGNALHFHVNAGLKRLRAADHEDLSKEANDKARLEAILKTLGEFTDAAKRYGRNALRLRSSIEEAERAIETLKAPALAV